MYYGKIKALIWMALNANPECTETFDDVQDAVKSGQAQFWEYEETIAVTQMKGVSLHIWLLAGKLGGVPMLIERSQEFAQEKGLHGIVIENWRRGWRRYLAPHGFYELNGWLVKEI